MKNKLAAEIRTMLLSNGADMVGFADLRGIPYGTRGTLDYGISIAVALNPEIVKGIESGPTNAYFAEYRRANRLLDSLGRRAAVFLEENRLFFFNDTATTETVADSETLTTPLPHKTVASRAGMGWIGKCALLVTESFGPAVRITSVLTDAALPAGDPVDSSKCGFCRACVDACPGKAPSGKHWSIDSRREDFFDAFACRKACLEITGKSLGEPHTVCGICIAVCPWTHEYIRASE